MTVPPDFEALYRRDADPWQVATSHYEQRKLDVVLACLARPRYALAWDPACGTGHLARRLAGRADRVRASDASTEAVALSRVTCAGLANVELRRLALPQPWPDQTAAPDLVVLSEFFYYLGDADRPATLRTVDTAAAPRCELLAVHWRHVPNDAWLAGATAQQEIVSRMSDAGWLQTLHHDDSEFVIDVLVRPDEDA